MIHSRFFTTLLLTIICTQAWPADTLQLYSPSGKICVRTWMDKQLVYEVRFNNTQIVAPSFIDLQLQDGRALSVNNAVKSSSSKKISESIISPVPEKRRSIPDIYNELTIDFKQPFSVEFRAYDDGVAYRMITRFKDSIVIKNEEAAFHFPGEPSAYFPEIPYENDSTDQFETSFEHTYSFKKIKDFPVTSIAYSPVLIVPSSDPKIGITEAGLEDYPGMFVKGTGASALRAIFAPYPLEEKPIWELYSHSRVTKKAGYIARTKGSRHFPWRVLMIAEEDKSLPSNDLVYRLSSPSRIGDASWVKPGNITDEWIIDVNIFDVPFIAGRNTATYKYYIDFAKRFGFSHIMLDAGWSDNNDLFKIVPEINIDTLVAYAKKQGVKLALWTLALTLNRQLDSALKQFNKWGVDFIMTDFINRDDQLAVRFHQRVAEASARYKIMVMFHGTYPPKGFNRTYPNAVTREAVLGSEYNMWSDKPSPDHDLLLPFTRMLAGSFDYEPGMLMNMTKKNFRNIEGYIMSQGTRSHQLAMLAVYDSPVQFFAGNPSEGWREPAFMELWGSLPSSWDETKILDAKVGEYIITARLQNNNWYIGGMTNWTMRDLEIKLDFLDDKATYKARLCKDGMNAGRYASDYIIESFTVKKNDSLSIHAASGGGFLLKLEKE